MREQVLNEEDVSRLILRPRMYDDDANKLIWNIVFEFPKRPCESAVWRKYAPADADVHRCGDEVEVTIRQRRPETRYVGFISANVGEIRSIETARGHGFSVNHEPGEGQGMHHVHICYRVHADQDTSALTKNDKNELKLLLREIFDEEMIVK
jgi:hypothetical protein